MKVPLAQDENAALAREAERLYRAALGRLPPALFAERFARAVLPLRASRRAEEVTAHRALLRSAFDLEALEIAARLTRRLPLLSAEFALVVRLAETFPENQPLFVAGPRSAWLAWSGLALAALRSVAKTALGFALLGLHPRG